MTTPSTGKKATSEAIAIAVGQRARPLRLAISGDWLGRWRAAWVSALQSEIDRRRLFLWLPVAFGLGILAYFSAEAEPTRWASGVPLVVIGAIGLAGRRHMAVLAAALAVCAFFAGFLAATWRSRAVESPVLVTPAFLTVHGRIEQLDRTVYGGRMVVRVADVAPAVERLPERVRVTFRGAPTFETGAGVSFKARLTPPSPASVPGGYDFQREAYFQRLGAVGFVTGAIALKPDVPPLPWLAGVMAAVDRARNALTERIIAVVGGSTGAISAALITGKRGQIVESDNDNWRAAGIYHLVSISGLHMMLAAGLFFWSARLVFALVPDWRPRIPTKKLAALVAMAGATAYDIFSGSDVATERALIMTLVMFGAVLVDRPALAMRNLAISALIILCFRPETVMGPSFQMSFSAVAGLVAFAEAERHWHQRRAARGDMFEQGGLSSAAARLVIAFVLTSLIAGLATAPFQAYHFHRLNPYGVLGNALAVPLCSFIVMPSALVGVLLYPLGIDAPVWWLMGQGVAGISHFAEMVSGLSGSVAAVGRFGGLALAMMTLGLLLLTLMTTLPFRITGVVVGGIGLVLASRAEKPALILDATGKTALVRTANGTLTMLGPTRPIFALQQWLSGDRDLRNARSSSALTEAARCDSSGCTANLPDGRAVALVLEAPAFADDCERAAIIITSLDAPIWCWDSAEVYDRAFFRSYGATYLYASSTGMRLETTRNARLDRPWAPKPQIRSSATTSPSAAPAAPPRQSSAPAIAPAWDPDAGDATPETDTGP